jgi:hypothetical protein
MSVYGILAHFVEKRKKKKRRGRRRKEEKCLNIL